MVEFVVALALSLLLASSIAGQRGVTNGEWRRTGGDGGSTRYSALDQISAANVRNLRIAWTWRGDNSGSGPEFKNETTPADG